MTDQDFGRYQLLKKLATGGMAEVWLARQHGIEGFERLAVVKRILPHLADDPEFLQMFVNEAKIAARFNHPNIAQIYELGETNGTFFIAMEYIHGEDLGRLMRKAWSAGQWIARPLSIRIVASACEGLHYAHNKTDDSGKPLKVVHRDISPQNILISFDGSVKVVDFGIAKAADQVSMTRSGAIKGKFAYMSPEQAGGKPLDNRSDIFAIGLVLYELLTGVRPLKRQSELATLQVAVECSIQRPSEVADVPAEVDGVVMRALAKAPEERYRDARAFQSALEEFLVGQRWVASSVQISELMATLFSDRLDEEKRLGQPYPDAKDGSVSGDAVAQPSLSDPAPTQQARTPGHGAIQEWEAPPGRTEPQGRAVERPSHPSGRKGKLGRSPPGPAPVTDPATLSRPAPGPGSADAPSGDDVEAGDARKRREPAGVGVTPGAGATVVARTPSRSDAPVGGERRPSGARLPEVPGEAENSLPPLTGTSQVSEAPRPSAAHVAASGGPPAGSGEAEVSFPVPVEAEPETLPPVRKKSAGAAAPVRRSSGLVMPEAPPPTRPQAPKPRVEAPKPGPADLPDLDDLKARSSHRSRQVLIASSIVAVLVMGLIFRGPIWEGLTHAAIDGQGVYVTVDSNPRVKVLVRHAREEAAVEPESELGETPLTAARGAHLRDTIILSNPDLGLYFEEPVRGTEPGKLQRIEKDFAKGAARITVVPRGLPGLSFWRGGQEVGRYEPGLKLELWEGTQRLEVRGDALKRPFRFDVQVPARATVDRTVDLTGYL